MRSAVHTHTHTHMHCTASSVIMQLYSHHLLNTVLVTTPSVYADVPILIGNPSFRSLPPPHTDFKHSSPLLLTTPPLQPQYFTYGLARKKRLLERSLLFILFSKEYSPYITHMTRTTAIYQTAFYTFNIKGILYDT